MTFSLDPTFKKTLLEDGVAKIPGLFDADLLVLGLPGLAVRRRARR